MLSLRSTKRRDDIDGSVNTELDVNVMIFYHVAVWFSCVMKLVGCSTYHEFRVSNASLNITMDMVIY